MAEAPEEIRLKGSGASSKTTSASSSRWTEATTAIFEERGEESCLMNMVDDAT